MSGPLSGLRVIDFSRVLAGPLCARTLLDLGADVVKVEPPVPDVTRFAAPSSGFMSGYYAQQNAGKRNISLDLNQPDAKNIALRLCEGADIIIENFRAGALRHFGLGYEDIVTHNPSVIYASITGYGQTGPWQSRMAYAPTVQAEAGFTANSRQHFGDPEHWQTDALSHADVYSGLQASIAILAALNERQKTGRGQYIDIAMAATLIAINERAHLDIDEVDLGDEPGVLGATDCPFFVDAAGDVFTVATSLVGSLTFPRYLAAMRRPDLLKDSRFATPAARRQNYGALHKLIQAWILSFTNVGALEAQLDEAKIAMGRVKTLKQVANSDWAEHWGAVQTVSDRAGGQYTLPGRPWKFSNGALKTLGDPAWQGEHNFEILSELGFNDAQIEEWQRDGTLCVTPSNLRANQSENGSRQKKRADDVRAHRHQTGKDFELSCIWNCRCHGHTKSVRAIRKPDCRNKRAGRQRFPQIGGH
jgi:crotonobetainyl-CoA:carnitine CoA-transferase CaiB-like acyl-CoA transferase